LKELKQTAALNVSSINAWKVFAIMNPQNMKIVSTTLAMAGFRIIDKRILTFKATHELVGC
jgi:hypothetical protein